jgi:peptidyl-prolyl cis-trans isomerase B (cyclophilin B)
MTSRSIRRCSRFGIQPVVVAVAVPVAMSVAMQAQQAARQTFFQSPLTLDQMKDKQAVVETDAGTFVIQLLPEAAPNHVAHFMTLAREGAYVGTIFHRVVRYGIIQGGDPLSKNPANAARYGQGGLNRLRREPNAEKHTAGAVSAVLVPGNPNSAGAQFFVCASDQPALDGQFTVFGRVVDGLEVVQTISATPANQAGTPEKRISITSVTIRDTPPPAPEPFATATVAEMAAYRATLDTTKGRITLQFMPDKAPETVRAFLRLAQAGVFDGVGIHRVVPNFVMQTGALAFRETPLTSAQQKLVRNLPAEFSDVPNELGIVSMARGEDPGSATTSFFICTGTCRSLDGQYTVFARVVAGLDTVLAIAAAPVDGETPREKILVRSITLEKSAERSSVR